MFSVVLAAIIAQTSASPEASATLPPTPQIMRRMPASTPRLRTGDVVIRNSGSTNSRGYTIVVHADHSADVTDGAGQVRRASVEAPQAKWLFAKVRAAMPLDALPAPMCLKSASFGSTLRISYEGVTSPDLNCGGDAAIRELSRTAGVVQTQLR